MTANLRKYHRENGHVPVTLVAQNGTEGGLLSKSFEGHISNISSHGACLLLTQVIKDAYHVFHTTRENDSWVLQLTITLPPESTLFSITAKPVWFDLFRKDTIQAYKMGVEFITVPDGKQIKHLLSVMRASQHPKLRSRWFAHLSPWKTVG